MGNTALFWILAVLELQAAEFSILQNTEIHSSLNKIVYFFLIIICIYSFLFFYCYGLFKELRATLNLANAPSAKCIQLFFLTSRHTVVFFN